MAEQSEVIREYLMSLGFRVNTQEQKKFDTALTSTTKIAVGAGSALVGVAAAAIATAQAFANSMEKLYYASQRSGTSIANLQASAFAAKQVGVSGEAIQGAIDGMAKTLRSNPGLQSMLNAFGIPVKGRQMDDVVTDTIRAFRSMPPYLFKQLTSMFGIDEDTAFALARNLEKYEKMKALQKEAARDAGFDADAAGKRAVDYDNKLDETMMRLKLLKDVLSDSLLGPMNKAVDLANTFLITLTKAINQSHSTDEFMRKMTDGKVGTSALGGLIPGPVRALGAVGLGAWKAKQWLGAHSFEEMRQSILHYGHGPNDRHADGSIDPLPSGATNGSAAAPGVDATQKMFADLEEKYNLPEGTLDSLWQQESNRGTDPNMNSPTDGSSSRGHFQMIAATRASLGLDDPSDIAKSADAAARLMHENLVASGGDLHGALKRWQGGYSAHYGDAANERYANQVEARIEQHMQINLTAPSPEIGATLIVNKMEEAKGTALRDVGGNGQ